MVLSYRSSMLLAQKMDFGVQKCCYAPLPTTCYENYGKLVHLSYYHLPHLQKQSHSRHSN